MSKEKQSKLDAWAERLDEWFGVEKKTLAQVKEQLALDGCSVSLSRLSEWWSARSSQHLQERLLGQIASGARACREVEEALGENGAPGLDVLIKLHRVLILKLSTEGNVEAEQLELVNRMMREVIKFARLEQLERQIGLDRDKFEFDAAKACLAALPELKVIQGSAISETEKVEQIRLKLFGVVAGKES